MLTDKIISNIQASSVNLMKLLRINFFDPLQEKQSLLQWTSHWLLACASAALFAGYFLENTDTFITIALYMLWIELIIAGTQWGLCEDNWPTLIAAGWLLACSLGVWNFFGQIYSPGPVPSATVQFLWLLLIGYLALRAGMHIGTRAQGISQGVEKFCWAVSPEHFASHSFWHTIFALCAGSCVGLCMIYAYFGSIPFFSDNPPLARYQFFNGPFTNNLFRFAFRVFSAVSMISSMYIIVLINNNLSLKRKITAFFCVTLTLLCVLGSGSRGDFCALVLFIGIRITFFWPAKKRLLPALITIAFCGATFCILTLSRIRSGLDSLSRVFPEISDAALLIQSMNTHDVPFCWGKTYLSALLSFVPSSIFPFRETYGFGRYSLEVFSLNETSPIAPTYGGLRPTFVGEAYLNGGLVGVILFGVVLGILLGAWRCRQRTIQNCSGGWVMFFLISLLTVMVSDFYGIFYGVVVVTCAAWAMERLFKRLACQN
ncbi:oligosaccharide repeat unit polymerase [Desulfovibrio desulfuricans]|uniref:Oligosaccharide repeat unit polymerase n=1 Tax=Desulfovibrio desulfuricans TaxID=876 RepID=A0A4V1CX19_DESDE|nr:oligosaccharide repeat unit polymerase [Desulfovibrio desulfuricans]QCC84680.1 oligosaccharide repeat unit polymerase [Desulfovibrio desulfuricans]